MWQVLEEREYDATAQAWQPRRQFIYGGQGIDDVVIFEKYNGTTEEWDSHYYSKGLYDRVLALTDGNGVPVEYYLYDPYGKVTFLDGSRQPIANRASDSNPYLFQSRRLDEETGLYYFRNRYYSPDLGRFLQRDPLGYVDGMNLYEFVGGRVVISLDPYGTERLNLHYRMDRQPSRWHDPSHAVHKPNLDSILSDAKERVGQYHEDGKEPCNCIQKLTLDHHGGVGVLALGFTPGIGSQAIPHEMARTRLEDADDSLQGTRYEVIREHTRFFEDFMRSISELMCKGGNIEFLQCRVVAGEGAVIRDYIDMLLPDRDFSITLHDGWVGYVWGMYYTTSLHHARVYSHPRYVGLAR